jgi:hypothetical protein
MSQQSWNLMQLSVLLVGLGACALAQDMIWEGGDKVKIV